MEMEGGINPDAKLDYVEFHIFPSQNRYEASVWSSNKEENVASGPLDQLLLHSPKIINLSLKGSDTNFKILRPESVNDGGWFTTTTITRFLHIIGLPYIISIAKEISQLEETRKFQLSLSDKAEVDVTIPYESKNELLLAVDLRLTALKEELAAAFIQASGSKKSLRDISDLENFALHFGAKNLRDSLQNLVELSTIPFEAAKIEMQCSAEGEDSTFSSEEDKPFAERSRGLTRSAMPRRSASPMKRIQIGRSGSRRAAALSIKSLNYFPAREKSTSQRDAAGNSSEEEDSQRPPKNNVLRMSVQDKISLFESKQRDQGVDIQKTKTSIGANIAVLRRWSSGIGERAEVYSPSSPKNVGPDSKIEPDGIYKTETCVETSENNSFLPEKGEPEQCRMEDDTPEPERDESCEKNLDSIDWNPQKGAELNELFTKLTESNPVGHQNVTGDYGKNKSPKEQRGGLFDPYKKRREEKLRGEASGKIADKEAKMDSAKVSGVNRRHAARNEPQKPQKFSTQVINPRTIKSSAVMQSTSKSSPLPATRKSWPSTPSPQAVGAAPARTPTGPTNRKPNCSASGGRSSTKAENLQPRWKAVKATQADANKRSRAMNKKKQPTVAENKKMTKTNVETSHAGGTATAKPSFYNKVTKKGSVVPLETKPFLRKGSGIGPRVGAIVKTKVVAQKTEENKVATEIEMTGQNQENEYGTLENHATIDLEPQVVSLSLTKGEDSESSGGDGGESRAEVSEINSMAEKELEISPITWVEMEEYQQDEIIPCNKSPIQLASPAHVTVPAGFSHPRVRHSLSQMLLEDDNEADISEWGNAEHPPTMVYQKDSSRGLKRLLKFARKAKVDSHLTSWSSLSAFSEGEDDAEEFKGQSRLGRFNGQNHPRVPEGQVSVSMNTTKATRSFFSLSAFRGNKANDSKLLHC